MNDVWYINFMEVLYKKYPKKNQLTEALMDLLYLEREAVYRRLRKDVVFPAGEIVKIATSWNISLDEIINLDSKQASFKLQLWNCNDPLEQDLDKMQMIVQKVKSVKEYPDVEYMEISNKLPRMLTAKFSCITRLYMLKWLYQYTNEKVIALSKLAQHRDVEKYTGELYAAIRDLPKVTFIWDNMIFSNLVGDVRYFHSINMISDEEKEEIKEELHSLLEYVFSIATKGCWPETGNKVTIYVSYINIDTNYYYYYWSGEAKLYCVNIFGRNELYTEDSEIAKKFKIWMQSNKKSSTQISESDEKSRIDFFAKQRQLIDEL
ncbi:MAG: hypothetical protein LBE91_17935 [Tannerella sp.]|jgi:hypothetical protein|nr:hypothetical protein [Tannerella sp.]